MLVYKGVRDSICYFGDFNKRWIVFENDLITESFDSLSNALEYVFGRKWKDNTHAQMIYEAYYGNYP